MILPRWHSSSSVRQVVSRVKEMPRSLPALLLQMPLQPEKFWRLYFPRESSVHKKKDWMLGGVYLFHLTHCLMVLPQNDIATRLWGMNQRRCAGIPLIFKLQPYYTYAVTMLQKNHQNSPHSS